MEYICLNCAVTFDRKTPKEKHCSLECSFWDKVVKREPSECWGWRGAKNFGGYGNIRKNGKMHIASRLSWEINCGPIPKGLFVCHTCDNPECTNPNHLWLGTPAENMIDKEEKGRGTRPPVRSGIKNNLTKISAEAVAEIKSAPRKEGVGAALARKYGIARNTVYRIRDGKVRANG